MASEARANPLRHGLRSARAAEPCIVVIFGASGDLTKRKLGPALYRRSQERLLPAEFAVVGISRTQMSDDDFRGRMKDAVSTFPEKKNVDEQTWTSFAAGIFYLPGDIAKPE